MECTSNSRQWEDLMREVLVEVFCRLGFEERYVNVALVCKAWTRAARDSACWSVADIEECFGKREESAEWWNPAFERRIDAMVRNVADWSCGLLLELHTRHCSDAAIAYAATRCPQLHSLSVKESPSFTDASTSLVAKHCPGLRLLDVTDCQKLSAASLKEIGSSCRGLVTLRRNMLTLEGNWQRRQLIPWDYLSMQPESSGDEEAAVIGSCMPQLETLEYRYSGLTDAGLDAIAQGCPKLRELRLPGCKRLSTAALDSAAEKLTKLALIERPVTADFIDSLRYGHWQLYSERFQPALEF